MTCFSWPVKSLNVAGLVSNISALIAAPTINKDCKPMKRVDILMEFSPMNLDISEKAVEKLRGAVAVPSSLPIKPGAL